MGTLQYGVLCGYCAVEFCVGTVLWSFEWVLCSMDFMYVLQYRVL